MVGGALRPTQMRWTRKALVGVVTIFVAAGALASYRAFYPISDVRTLVAALPVRAGTAIRVDAATSGRGPVSIRVELVQGDRSATLVLDRVRSRRWAFWDFRRVPHATQAVVSGATLAGFRSGKAVVRSTLVGSRAWLRQPPPVVDEVAVELDVVTR